MPVVLYGDATTQCVSWIPWIHDGMVVKCCMLKLVSGPSGMIWSAMHLLCLLGQFILCLLLFSMRGTTVRGLGWTLKLMHHLFHWPAPLVQEDPNFWIFWKSEPICPPLPSSALQIVRLHQQETVLDPAGKVKTKPSTYDFIERVSVSHCINIYLNS